MWVKSQSNITDATQSHLKKKAGCMITIICFWLKGNGGSCSSVFPLHFPKISSERAYGNPVKQCTRSLIYSLASLTLILLIQLIYMALDRVPRGAWGELHTHRPEGGFEPWRCEAIFAHSYTHATSKINWIRVNNFIWTKAIDTLLQKHKMLLLLMKRFNKFFCNRYIILNFIEVL